jgi:hypothetical protein
VGVSAINFSVAKEAFIPEGELVATYLFSTSESEAVPTAGVLIEACVSQIGVFEIGGHASMRSSVASSRASVRSESDAAAAVATMRDGAHKPYGLAPAFTSRPTYRSIALRAGH